MIVENFESVLSDSIKMEESLDLYEYKYKELPIWRLFRFNSRNRLLKKLLPQYTNKSLRRNKKDLFIHYSRGVFSSFFAFIKLLKFHKQIDNLIFAFPRLQNIKGFCVDKFTDPFIDQSDISNSCIVLQAPGKNIYYNKRWKEDRVIKLDFIYFITFLAAYLYLPIHYLTSYRNYIDLLYDRAKNYFGLTKLDRLKWHVYFCRFLIQNKQYKFLFNLLSVKRVFVVNREVFQAPIYAAHLLNITSYELQHGVTHGITPLYSGLYSECIDPDFFLTFGKKWVGVQFSMPLKQIINVGWAYKDFIYKYIGNYEIKENAILFISSPAITTKIINCIIELAVIYTQCDFHIRCHPQEMISDNLKTIIRAYKNIYVTDNSIDSYIALSSYNYIVGENSTVLYEALSLNKNVARLSYGGFSPSVMDKFNEDGFFYLKSINDFEDFLKKGKNSRGDVNEIYSSFDANIVNNLI